MAYSTDMQEAAKRHFIDGRELEDQRRYDNAGYHYGLSAECAIKFALGEAGVRDDDAALWRHFPELSQWALLAITTRSAAKVRSILQRPNFMQGWQIKMRYASNGSVLQTTAEKWRGDANYALGLLY